jgi:5-methylcytosine-specific restriction endonuclease McrA
LATPRNTTTRDRHRTTIRRDKPPCGICGHPIDYTLRYPHPNCFVVDHIQPVIKGGPDTLDNKQAAHNHCNRDKSDKLNYQPGVTFVTERKWW